MHVRARCLYGCMSRMACMYVMYVCMSCMHVDVHTWCCYRVAILFLGASVARMQERTVCWVCMACACMYATHGCVSCAPCMSGACSNTLLSCCYRVAIVLLSRLTSAGRYPLETVRTRMEMDTTPNVTDVLSHVLQVTRRSAMAT
jgi:hypothetical protein